MTNEPGGLAQGQLTTVDCIAQSLAVGPIFSGAALGSLVAILSGGVGPFVIVLVAVGFLGLGWTISEFAKRYTGAGTELLPKVVDFDAHMKKAAYPSA